MYNDEYKLKSRWGSQDSMKILLGNLYTFTAASSSFPAFLPSR